MEHTDTLTDKPLWERADFQAWEHGQVHAESQTLLAQGTALTCHEPGPDHWINSAGAVAVGAEIGDTVHRVPMLKLVDDHTHQCQCDQPEGFVAWNSSMRVAAMDYPDPQDTTYGPLLLGPEPK